MVVYFSDLHLLDLHYLDCPQSRYVLLGYQDVKGTNIIEFMDLDKIAGILKGKVATYTQNFFSYWAQKKDPKRVQITAGESNKLPYLFEFTTRIANLTTFKIIWNSTVSAKGAQYA